MRLGIPFFNRDRQRSWYDETRSRWWTPSQVCTPFLFVRRRYIDTKPQSLSTLSCDLSRRTLWRRTMRHSCVSDNRLAICDSHTPAYKRAAAQLNLPTTHSPHLSPAHTQLHSPSTTSLLWSSMDLQTVPTWPPPATPLTSSSRIHRQAPDASCPAPVLQQDNTRAETPITGIDTAQLRGRRRRSRGSPPPPPPRSARTSRNTPTTSSRHRARPQEAQHEAQRGGGG